MSDVFICAKTDSPDSHPRVIFTSKGESGKSHRDWSGDCTCGGAWISEAEYDRRVNDAWNRVLGFPKGYTGPRYQGYSGISR